MLPDSEKTGCEVLFLDAHAEGLTLEETVQRLGFWTRLCRLHVDNLSVFSALTGSAMGNLLTYR